MKPLSASLPLALAIGGLAAALTLVLPFERVSSVAWLIGALLAAVVGGIALVVKLRLGNVTGLTAAAAMKAVLGAQVATFLLRLLAVGVGAFAVKEAGFSPIMFAVSFSLVSLGQQVLETKSLLSARQGSPVKSEVTP